MFLELIIALILLSTILTITPKTTRYLEKKYRKLKAKFVILKIQTEVWKNNWMFKREMQFYLMKLTVENWFYENISLKKWCSQHGWHCPDTEKCEYESYNEPQPIKNGFFPNEIPPLKE